MVFDRPWEGNECGEFTCLRDNGLYRIYYRASNASRDEQGNIVKRSPMYTCYAESRDRITWTRPSLGLFEAAGTRDNNVILTEKHGRRVELNFSPFVDTGPRVPPEESYKGIGGMTGMVFALVSPDGINWRKLVEEPVIEGYNAHNLAFWDMDRGEYRSYCRHRRIAAYQAGMDELGEAPLKTADQTGLTEDGRDNGRDIITSTSKDFIHWTKPLIWSGSELVMNYSTSAAGSVQVELQDAQGVPLPGFALADSEVMYGDSLEQPMLWKNNPDLGKWAGTPVRLRFVLKDADLFSLRFR